jgi:hypothetical protein
VTASRAVASPAALAGLIRLVESKRFREIKLRDEDAFDIGARWGKS